MGSAFDADNGSFGTESLLGRKRTDDGVVTIDGGSNATAGQAGADTLTVVFSHARPHRVANIPWHEVVLILVIATNGSWDRRNGRDSEIWGVCRRTVRDARDVSDLDDVGGASNDGGRDGASSGLSLAAMIVELITLLVAFGSPRVATLATLPHTEPIYQTGDDEEGDTTNDTTGDSTDVGTGALFGRIIGGLILRTDSFWARVARFGDVGATFILSARGTGGRFGGTVDDASSKGVV